MLSNLFIAKTDEVTNDTDPLAHPNVNIKPVETVRLEALATAVGTTAGELEPLDTSGERFVIPVDDELVGRLAALDAQAIEKTAVAWGTMEAWAPEQPAAAEVHALLSEMCALAARATRESKQLYLWLSL